MIDLTKVEISKSALVHNIKCFRRLLGDKLLAPCVKANAYGHGLVECGKIFLEAGADWLSVNSLYEAEKLREDGIKAPIYIMGYVSVDSLERAVDLDCRLVVYNTKTIQKLGEIGKKVYVHLKIETGNNRQGIYLDDLPAFVDFISEFKNIEIEGCCTHFANIEDTGDHSFAKSQLQKFGQACDKIESMGINIRIKHCANSAATILFPETHFDMARIGISAYGMWSSKKTQESFSQRKNLQQLDDFELQPAFTWKTKVMQIKNVKQGEFVGYGCTYKAEKDIKLAVLGIGYYDGYDRGISTEAYVLIHDKKAHIRGRVCMNMIMVDVSEIPEVELEDDVILMGKDGSESISAEQFAGWCDTINYEVTTRVNDRIPRIIV